MSETAIETETHTDVPESQMADPKPPQDQLLALGAQGPEVRDLQQRLALIGENPGTIDGNFGPETEEAVRVFQAKAGLAVTGVADSATRIAIRKQVESRRVLIHPGIADRLKRTLDAAETAVTTPVAGTPIDRAIAFVKGHPGLVLGGLAVAAVVGFSLMRSPRVSFGEFEEADPLDEDEGLAMVIDAPARRKRKAKRKAKRAARGKRSKKK